MFGISVLGALIVAFGISQVSNLATTLYLHRSLTHRSITMKPWLESVFRFVLWVTVGIDRREWVAVHRKHHVFTDESADPHSPLQKGVLKVFLFNAGYYRREADQADTIATYGRDIAPDRMERALFSRGLLGPLLGLLALCVFLGPIMGVLAGGASAVFYIAQGGMVNSFAHHFGKRPHENSASNLRWLALLTGGEGMHNDHHEFPRSPLFGNSWWDIGGKLATGMNRLGWLRMHCSTRMLRQTQLSILQEPLEREVEPVG